jgi:1-deoxy-D-xylulose-5-phosphate synthase
MRLLDSIEGPEALKALSLEQLEELAVELRETIISTVNTNGGHLASPLGVIELTLALHHVYEAEKDRLIWDVGHQCYAHKLLTGRRDVFSKLRRRGGISGYPKRTENPHDAFGVGHSSTSISAALGMAAARDQQKQDHHVVAIIGDGAMTGGMALEAMSNAGHLGLNMLVILNDNEMSISPNVGALSHYFNRMITDTSYKRAKEDVGSYVKRLIGNRMTRRIQDLEKSVKGFITKGGLFQEFGFNYIGPVDGHDLPMLIECLHRIKEMHGPVLLHCRTEKGKGLKEAEDDPQKYHGIKPNDVLSLRTPKEVARGDAEGVPVPAHGNGTNGAAVLTFTEAFSEALLNLAAKDERVVAITAAMPAGTGLSPFEAAFPDRFYDVGICEQHGVTFAAGLAAQGMRPVLALYSTFMQRGYDQAVHDVGIQGLPVIFALDRAGLVGEDSPTHDGLFDLSFMRAIPGLTVLAPRDTADLQAMLAWALKQSGPVAIRYARGKAHAIGAAKGRSVEHGEILRPGSDATFLGVGPCLAACLEAAESLEGEGFSVAVADARRVKPLDTDLLDGLRGRPIVTAEENTITGGFGSAVLEHFCASQSLVHTPVHQQGAPDCHARLGSRDEQLADFGLDAAGLAESMRAILQRHGAPVLK